MEALLAAGRDVILEIDWQGARQVRQSAPGCTTIFILPPSRAALEERLRNRQTDSDAVIARRLQDAVGDMSHYREFGYVVVNDDFDTRLPPAGEHPGRAAARRWRSDRAAAGAAADGPARRRRDGGLAKAGPLAVDF